MIDILQSTAGGDLLRTPVLPLVGMVQFIFFTGDFATVDEVIAQLPAPIETGFAVYPDPAAGAAGGDQRGHPGGRHHRDLRPGGATGFDARA